MITILNISDTKFSYNGIAYFKNFTPFVTGNKVSIVNTYDTCISLTNFPTIYSDISVDGVTYGSVSALQNALLPVLFNRTFTQAGSLTAGHIPKATGINTLGNSLIYDNGTNVGIGTTSYSGYKLDVNGTGRFGGSLTASGILSTSTNYFYNANELRLYNSNNTNWGVIKGSSSTSLGDISILGGSGNGIFVASGGNVGIGTTAPTSKLQVVGLSSYADNAAAIAGGLTVGAFYHTSGTLKVVI